MARTRPVYRTLEEEIAAKLDAYLKTMHQKDFEEIIENIKKKNTPASSFWNIFSKTTTAIEKDEKFDQIVNGLHEKDILSQSMMPVETQTAEQAPTWGQSIWNGITGIGGYFYTPAPQPVKKPKSIKRAISDLIKEDEISSPWTETSPNTAVLRELIKKTPEIDPNLDLNCELIFKVRPILSQRLIQAQKAVHGEVLKKDSFNNFTIMEKLANERQELIANEGIRPKKYVAPLNTTSDHEKELLDEANRLREEAKLLCEKRVIISDDEKHQENNALINEAKELCVNRDVELVFPEQPDTLSEPEARLGEAQELCKNREIPELEIKEEKRAVDKAEVNKICKTPAEIRARLNSLFSAQVPDVVEKSRKIAKQQEASSTPRLNVSRG